MKVKKVKALVTSDFLQPHGLVAHQASLFVEFSRQEYWSGSHSLLQGTLLIQGSNLGFLHCRQILYCLSNQGSTEKFLEVIQRYSQCYKLEKVDPLEKFLEKCNRCQQQNYKGIRVRIIYILQLRLVYAGEF